MGLTQSLIMQADYVSMCAGVRGRVCGRYDN